MGWLVYESFYLAFKITSGSSATGRPYDVGSNKRGTINLAHGRFSEKAALDLADPGCGAAHDYRPRCAACDRVDHGGKPAIGAADTTRYRNVDARNVVSWPAVDGRVARQRVGTETLGVSAFREVRSE